MATADAAAIAAEIAASLSVEEIPFKLRCAGCNKLAVNAFRMPCCDQALCETCQEELDTNCPVCLHEPVQKQDCKPNKSLRVTIKAFLKRKAMDREAAKKKELALSTKVTPAASAVPDTPIEGAAAASVEVEGSPRDTPQAPSRVPAAQGSEGDGQQTPTDAQMDIPRPSIETTNETQNQDHKATSDATENGNYGQNKGQMEQNGQNGIGAGVAGQNMFNGMMGFDGMNGAFPMMPPFSGVGDFSQMMAMMPNAMQNNMLGGFPNMMGMPGMGMDQMTMPQMYGGFGGPSVGMNGMNMGMGFNAGQGAFGGFNGQTDAWNSGQNNFNPNAYGGHANGMGGDFGAQNTYGGYNMPSHQGNFQNHHQQFQNDFQNGYNTQGYQGRGRGRGRGYNAGRGRGGYNQLTPGNHANHQANYEPFHHQLPQQNVQHNLMQYRRPSYDYSKPHDEAGKGVDQSSDGAPENPTQDVIDASKAIEHDISKEFAPGGEDDDKDEAEAAAPVPETESKPNPETPAPPVVTEKANGLAEEPIREPLKEPVKETKDEEKIEVAESKPAPIQTFISNDEDRGKPLYHDLAKPQNSIMPPPGPALPAGPVSRYSQDSIDPTAVRGRGYGRNNFRGADVRGGYRGRGSGYVQVPNGTSPISPIMRASPTYNPMPVPTVEPKGLGVEGAPTGPKALREGSTNASVRGGRGLNIVGRASTTAYTKSNGVARSPSPTESRHRSRSPRSRSRSPHRSNHHRSYRELSRSPVDEAEHERRKERHRRRSRRYEDEETNGVDLKEEPRKRDHSLESSSKRSSHRRHRDQEADPPPSSHRHRRERSRDRDDEGRRHKRRRTRSPDSKSVVPTPTLSEAPPLTPVINSPHEPKDDSRKRRERDDERDYDRSKRTRRDQPATPDENDSYRSSRRNSKRDEEEPQEARPQSTSNHNNTRKPPSGPAADRIERSERGERSERNDRNDRNERPDRVDRTDRNDRNVEKPERLPPPSRPSSSKPSSAKSSAPPVQPPAPKSTPAPAPAAPKGPEKDHHTLEREARNRERLMKEMQRREANEGKGGGAVVKGSGRKGSAHSGGAWQPVGRRMSYKYEDEESDEARHKRVEAEREAERWK